MTKHHRLMCLAFGLIMFAGTGCTPKPVAREYRQQAAAEDVTFPMVLANPEAYAGYVVLWGGIIIDTKNLKDGTHITVLETPLHGSERPKSRSFSQGRFIARSARLLDPEIYQQGKKITVAGVVSGRYVVYLSGDRGQTACSLAAAALPLRLSLLSVGSLLGTILGAL